MSPYLQNPLTLGADIVVHSGTKYLSGHNDTIAGFTIVNDNELRDRLRFLYKTTGAGLSPFDSWLLLRGIQALADVPKDVLEKSGITDKTLRMSVGIENVKDLIIDLEEAFHG